MIWWRLVGPTADQVQKTSDGTPDEAKCEPCGELFSGRRV
jgi:hypothetical protein